MTGPVIEQEVHYCVVELEEQKHVKRLHLCAAETSDTLLLSDESPHSQSIFFCTPSQAILHFCGNMPHTLTAEHYLTENCLSGNYVGLDLYHLLCDRRFAQVIADI